MTREAWHEGTYSHGWGTSPIAAVAWGILGVRQTAPGWAAFTVMPKLGPLTRARGTIPTLRGFVNVTVGPGALDVAVPCNSAATLCSPRAAADAPTPLTTAAFALSIDGVEVAAVERAGHLCAAAPVGCGAGGAPRAVRARARAL
jgi:alpha-L-rhamnosidase